MIKLAKLQRTYRKSTSKDGYYECILHNDNNNGKVLWTFKLAEDFVNEYLEGKNHTIKITYDGKVMNETHSYVNNRTESYKLAVDEDGYLVMIMQHGSVTARRFYKSDKNTVEYDLP
ncbi:hypothetical protein AAVH_03515 [Aphelenchoides avenae]|nr:hypothetical protein AAVH_03515 [Aphelenchus avenae]